RAIGRPQLSSEVGSDVDIDQACHAEPAEERAPALRAPDNAAGDDGASLDFFVGPDLDAWLDDGTLVHDGVVADNGSLEHHRLALDAGGGADQRAAQLRPFADIRVIPDHAAIYLCPVVHNRIVADSAGAVYQHTALDLAVMAQKDRAEDLGVGGGLDAVL